MSLSSASVSKKISLLEGERIYNKYLNLLHAMGPIDYQPYSIEGLAVVQSDMMKARKKDRINPVALESNHWIVGASEDFMDFEVHDSDMDPVYYLHPIYTFYEHVRSFDEPGPKFLGIYTRGDSSFLPLLSEGGEVYFLCTKFHKGDFSVQIIYFPDRPFEVKEKLYDLLNQYETR